MKNTLTLLLLTFTVFTFSQTTLLEEDFSSGLPVTWSTIDADGHTPGVSEFTDAWIGYSNAFDTCAASTSYYVDSNGDEDSVAASDYLITPKITLLNGNTLRWDAKSLDGSYPDGYEVLISTTDNLESSFTVIKTISSESQYWTSYSVNLMSVGTGYSNQDVYIAFRNTTTAGYVLQLDNISVIGDDPAGLTEDEIDLSIYPNPMQNVVTITATNFEKASFYNAAGQLVLESSLNQIDVSTLPKGIYIVQVKTEDGIRQKKLIKS